MLILPEAGRPVETVDEHGAILRAIEARDAEAARVAMSRHLRQLIHRIEPLEQQYPDYFCPS